MSAFDLLEICQIIARHDPALLEVNPESREVTLHYLEPLENKQVEFLEALSGAIGKLLERTSQQQLTWTMHQDGKHWQVELFDADMRLTPFERHTRRYFSGSATYLTWAMLGAYGSWLSARAARAEKLQTQGYKAETTLRGLN